MLQQYTRGSEWGKWDLHVHTPASIVQNYGGDTPEVWENFIADLENLPKEFKVIGINDYLFIDGYAKIKSLHNEGRLSNIDLLLPVLEFRLRRFAGTEQKLKKINFHVVFSNEIDTDVIQDQFINALSPKYKLGPGTEGVQWRGTITRQSVADLGKAIKETVPEEKLDAFGSDLQEGFNNLVLDVDDILEILSESTYFHKEGLPLYLTAVGKTEWEDIKWTDGSIATKKDIINKVDFVFISSENVEKFNNAKRKLAENRVNDLLLDCSDAHNFASSNEKDRIGKCLTWIKANPIFEGLKYVVYDPEERVCFQDEHPSLSFRKPFLSKISIQEVEVFNNQPVRFTDAVLQINSGLVAIVGGRGTGKSLLLDAIAKTFKKKPKFNQHRIDMITIQSGFSVEYTKNDGSCEIFQIGDGSNHIPYLHVHQNEVQEIVRDPQCLSATILEMLNLTALDNDSIVEEETISLLGRIDELKRWLELNNKECNQTIIDKNNQLISVVTTNANKELIERYTRNSSAIINCENHIAKLDLLRSKLELIANDINREIHLVNDEAGRSSIVPVDFSGQYASINTLISNLNGQISVAKTDNVNIQQQLQSAGVEGDVTTLFQKVQESQSEVETAQIKLKEIEIKEAELESLLQKRALIVDALDSSFNEKLRQIQEKWQELINGKEGWNEDQRKLVRDLLDEIEISGEIVFDIDKFYESIESCLNRVKFRSRQGISTIQRIRSTLNVDSYDAYKRLLKNEPIIKLDTTDNLISLEEFLEEDCFSSDGNINCLNNLFLETHRRKYLNLLAKTQYQSKQPQELSIGQRGTLFICLKLATDSFFDPFIFDQPEDDLDNAFIMEKLVPIFKKIKKYRQVIIATHNANLVVNADAEQVIIAHNDSEKLSYTSGSLENSTIKQQICNVLEGGKEAFKRREQKYGLM